MKIVAANKYKPSKFEKRQIPVDPQPVVIDTTLTDIGFGSAHCMNILSSKMLPCPTLTCPAAQLNQNETISLQFKMFGVSTCNIKITISIAMMINVDIMRNTRFTITE